MPSQPGVPQSTNRKSEFAWSEEDDICLIQLIQEYHFNWDLVCDGINALRGHFTKVDRTPRECYERWKDGNLTSVTGQINPSTYETAPLNFEECSYRHFPAYIAKLKRGTSKREGQLKGSTTRRRQRQYNVFEAIKRSQRKRDQVQKQSCMPFETLLSICKADNLLQCRTQSLR